MPEIKIVIIQPHQIKLERTCDQVVVPGVDGDFGILPGHTAFITKIRPGVLKVFDETEMTNYAIHDGFVTVESDVVKIVCDVIEEEAEIDVDRAQDAKLRAEKRLQGEKSDVDFRRAEFALKRAITRLEIKQ
ncbi:MAG: ATP synthase F1 subunit epsilon [Candidatus Cloacimonetes bacterium]|nr:ATP synthase F1 subunit epsilon [Candidatus Cloacimonadota bacterium]